MRDQGSYAPRAASWRDVAAIWICCAIAAAAVVLPIGRSDTDISGRSANTGIYLPGRDVVRSLDRRDADLDDEVEQVRVPPGLTQLLLCSAREDPPYTTAAMSPDRTPPPLKC
ncbi:MAG TPA: hypothetical protein VM782_09275 [Stellaceae bacterium]|nr:hypothetical protein [Stellaceae bacterium]